MLHISDWESRLVPKGPRPKSLADRFWPKIQKGGPDECWIWTGGVGNHGYGSISIGSRIEGSTRTKILVHRLAYELLIGPIPDGLVLDHLCKVPRCVNPKHLDPVTQRENFARGNNNMYKTHCPQGHPYDETNTRLKKGRWGFQRICKKCEYTYQRRYDATHPGVRSARNKARLEKRRAENP